MRHSHQDIIPLLAALRAGAYEQRRHDADSRAPRPHAPFVTVSRQAGAGGRSFAKRLALRLNEIDPGELPWSVWDNEIVERVAAEYHVPASRIAALEESRPSWLEEALGSLAIGSTGTPTDERSIYRRVATTIHALAEIGRVIIVGRGAAFVTGDVAGGAHVRLVAPRERRIATTATALGVSTGMAADWVSERDRARESFYRRHWPSRPLIPENFTATFNTAAVTGDELVESVLTLILHAGSGARAVTPQATTVPA